MLPPTARPTISRHIKGVLESGELDADSVVAFFLQQFGGSKLSILRIICVK